MRMSITINSQVCLLLTTRFSQRDETEVLSPWQWGDLCQSLGGVSNLGTLLDGSAEQIMQDCNVNRELQGKVVTLLSRGVGLALASEKWLRAGVWVIGAGDPEYPLGLSRLEIEKRPPLLFGYGSFEMLEQPSVAVDERLSKADIGKIACVVDDLRASTVGLLDRRHSRAIIRETLSRGGQALAVTYKDLVGYGSTAELRDAIMNGSLTVVSSKPPGQHDNRGPVYEKEIVVGLSDSALTQNVLERFEIQEPEGNDPPAQQLDFEF